MYSFGVQNITSECEMIQTFRLFRVSAILSEKLASRVISKFCAEFKVVYFPNACICSCSLSQRTVYYMCHLEVCILFFMICNSCLSCTISCLELLPSSNLTTGVAKPTILTRTVTLVGVFGFLHSETSATIMTSTYSRNTLSSWDWKGEKR